MHTHTHTRTLSVSVTPPPHTHTHAHTQYADLSHADLEAAIMNGATLYRTNLSSANLNDTMLFNTDLQQVCVCLLVLQVSRVCRTARDNTSARGEEARGWTKKERTLRVHVCVGVGSLRVVFSPCCCCCVLQRTTVSALGSWKV